MYHKLKTFKRFVERVISKEKTFEVRKNDRDFQKGDIADLIEIDDKTKEETGRCVQVDIVYVLPGGRWGIEENYCVLGIKER